MLTQPNAVPTFQLRGRIMGRSANANIFREHSRNKKNMTRVMWGGQEKLVGTVARGFRSRDWKSILREIRKESNGFGSFDPGGAHLDQWFERAGGNSGGNKHKTRHHFLGGGTPAMNRKRRSRGNGMLFISDSWWGNG